MAEEKLLLSALDQNTVRVYTQVFLVFPFPDINQAEAAIQALERGLHATLASLPFLTGQLSLTDDDSGRLNLTYPSQTPDLRASGIFAWKIDESVRHYEQLRKEGMPPSTLPGSKFRPDDLANYPGVPADGEGIVNFDNGNIIPVMRIQAIFIPGGLALGFYVHHTAMDCAGINILWKHFASNVSKPSIGDKLIGVPAKDNALDQSTMRKQLDERAPTYACGQTPSAEAYVDGKYKYEKFLPEDADCSLKYFIIDTARINAYRAELKEDFPAEPPPTICNVIAALLWIHVTRARARRRQDSGTKVARDEVTNIGIATDMRKSMDPPLPKTYTGNMALFSKGTLKVEDVLAENVVTKKTVIHAIQEIRRTLARVDNDWASDHVGFFKSIEKITDTECGLAFRFGMDIYITSWLNFGADVQWGIPGTDLDEKSLGGRPEFIRRSYGLADGGMMIMPRRRHQTNGKDAPYEVMVRLATVDMERLLKEEAGLSTWAERII